MRRIFSTPHCIPFAAIIPMRASLQPMRVPFFRPEFYAAKSVCSRHGAELHPLLNFHRHTGLLNYMFRKITTPLAVYLDQDCVLLDPLDPLLQKMAEGILLTGPGMKCALHTRMPAPNTRNCGTSGSDLPAIHPREPDGDEHRAYSRLDWPAAISLEPAWDRIRWSVITDLLNACGGKRLMPFWIWIRSTLVMVWERCICMEAGRLPITTGLAARSMVNAEKWRGFWMLTGCALK